MPAGPELFLSAGEISGDAHAAALLRALREIRPGIGAWGVGGPALAREGQEQCAGIDALSLVGITEVLPRLGSILRLLRRLGGELARRRPRAVILVDAPDFNLRLAATAHRLGLPVIYFISPQVWAWRRGRVRPMRRTVDQVLCILPFEERFFRERGLRASYVGHPLVDTVAPSAPVPALRAEFGLDPARPVVAMLPGSRPTEVRALLGPLCAAARILASREPRPQVLVPAASPAIRALLVPLEGPPIGARVTHGRAWDCLAAADAAVVASGTATLEAALLGTPFLAVYRLSPLSHLTGRLLVRVPWVSLPNLLLGEPAVTELIQGACRPERIAAEVARLLDDTAAAARLREKCAKVRGVLGPGGAARRAAERIVRELERRPECPEGAQG